MPHSPASRPGTNASQPSSTGLFPTLPPVFSPAEAVVGSDGQPRFGLFREPPESVNIADARPGGLTQIAQPMTGKKWLYVGLFSRDFVLGSALIHTGYAASWFVYGFDAGTHEFDSAKGKDPLGRSMRIESDLRHGVCAFERGATKLRFEFGRLDGWHTYSVAARGKNGPIEVEVSIRDDFAHPQPLGVVTPQPNGRFSFTHKAVTLPVKGRIRIGSRSWDVGEAGQPEVWASLDYSAGYFPRDTAWRWASACGRLADGRVFGLNLVDPIYHERYNENAMWVGGEMVKLGRAYFEYSKDRLEAPWQVYTAGGEVRLSFAPRGVFEEHFNAGVLRSDFNQPYGSFTGEIRGADGATITLDNCPGVVEDNRVIW
jgi:hypothetical protein